MRTIRVPCPTCGKVGVQPDAIDLVIGLPLGGPVAVSFTCPDCGQVVRARAESDVRAHLIGLGVTPTTVLRASWPPFTHDDLLDFHHLLERDDWYQRLVAVGSFDGAPRSQGRRPQPRGGQLQEARREGSEPPIR